MRKTRGFSMIELVLAAAITMMVATFGIYSLRGGRTNAMSRGMAQEIAEELGAARQLAISKQKPVAIAFPSSGNNPASQSFYQLEGLTTPLISREVDYKDTYPQSYFYWGNWGGTLETSASTGLETDYLLSDWTLPEPKDFVLYFTPSGTVQSNGLPVYSDGEYRLLVSNGVSPGGAGGGTLPLGAAPGTVSKPYTVHISKSGAISVQPGVSGIAPTDVPAPIAMTGSAAAVPDLPEIPGTVSFEDLTSEPKPRQPPGGGNYAVVPEQGYITLVAKVKEERGEAPMVRWVSEHVGGGLDGRFSAKTWFPMEYNFRDKIWVARVAWTPPKNAGYGETFNLTCKVRSHDGEHEIERQLGASTSVGVVKDERIATICTDGDWGNYYVAWMNSYGTNVINVTNPAPVWEQLTPVWHPNGTKLSFYSGDFPDEGADDFHAVLYIVNEDGKYLRKLFETDGDITDYMFGPSFSPEGGFVAFSAYEGVDGFSRVNVQRVYNQDVDGPYVITLGPDAQGELANVDHTDVSWHPSKSIILYTVTQYPSNSDSGTPVKSGIYAVRFDPNKPKRGTTYEAWPIVELEDGKEIGESHWSYNGRRMCYTEWTSGKLYCKEIDEDGHPKDGDVGAGKDITPPGFAHKATSPRFSPDGNEVAVIDYHPTRIADDLWVVNPDNVAAGYKVTNIGEVYGYNWSPGGQNFVFATWSGQLRTIAKTGAGSSKNISPAGFFAWSTPSWWSKY